VSKLCTHREELLSSAKRGWFGSCCDNEGSILFAFYLPVSGNELFLYNLEMGRNSPSVKLDQRGNALGNTIIAGRFWYF